MLRHPGAPGQTGKIPAGWKRAQTTTVGKRESILNSQDGHFTEVKITFLIKKHAVHALARKERPLFLLSAAGQKRPSPLPSQQSSSSFHWPEKLWLCESALKTQAIRREKEVNAGRNGVGMASPHMGMAEAWQTPREGWEAQRQFWQE